MTMPPPATFADCRATTRRHARSFYAASFLLPPAKRMAAYAVYAFCRYADDMIDGAAAFAGDRRAALEALRRRLDEAYDHASPEWDRHPLAMTVRRYAIPREYFHALLDGVAMDLETTRMAGFAQLDRYCYHVASVVGLIMAHIFGYAHPAALPYAADLGTAMQLTNILRDIPDDFRLGRVYIPQDELASSGYTEDDIARGVVDDRFRALMRLQIARARGYYDRARLGIPFLTDDGSRTAAVMMAKFYSAILGEIERGGFDVYSRRHHIGTAAKLRMLAGYLLLPGERRAYAAAAREAAARQASAAGEAAARDAAPPPPRKRSP